MISNKNILKLEIRKQIYEYISKNPGAHIRKIAIEKKISKSSVIHHLNILIKKGLIEEKTIGMYRRIYLKGSIGSKEKELVDLLRQDTPRKIFLYLAFSLSFTQSELSKELNLTPATTNHHLKKFIKLGVIEKVPSLNGKVFPFKGKNIVMHRKNVSNEAYFRRKEQWPLNVMWKFLLKYKSSFDDKEFIKSYEDYLNNIKASKEKMPKKLKSINSRIDGFVNVLNEIITPPFIA